MDNEKTLEAYAVALCSDIEKVENIRKKAKFSKTNNNGWNARNKGGGFNAPKNIGYVMRLIKDIRPATIQEWVEGYFRSGQQRNIADSKTDGRTVTEIKELSLAFKEECFRHGIKLSDEEAFDYSIIRVLYETYLGYTREMNTINNLDKEMNKIGYGATADIDSITFKRNEAEMEEEHLDFDYAIDAFIIDDQRNAVAGIQIKSMKWKEGSVHPGVIMTNHKKMEAFSESTGLPAYFIYSSTTGDIDEDSLMTLKNGLMKGLNL